MQKQTKSLVQRPQPIMKTSPSTSSRLAGLCAGLVLTAVHPVLHAADPAADVSIEAGVAVGRLDVPGDDADLLGAAAGLQWEVGKLLITDFSLRADLLHLESQDNTDFRRDELDVDARFSVSVLGFMKPYIGAGVSVVRNDSGTYTPEDDWTPGYGLGAGVGFTIIPKLLHTTPAVRYAQFEDLRTMTYSLDTALHFTVVGVGLRVGYEDNLSRDGNLATAVLYANLRF